MCLTLSERSIDQIGAVKTSSLTKVFDGIRSVEGIRWHSVLLLSS